MTRRRKIVATLVGVPLVAVALLATIGSLKDSHILTVTRSTCADRDVVWDLWANVPQRVKWDKGLEYINVDGPFEVGTTGTVKVEGQGPIKYRIMEVDPKNRYTDRFEKSAVDPHRLASPDRAKERRLLRRDVGTQNARPALDLLTACA